MPAGERDGPRWDLLVLGELNADVVVSGGDVEPVFGQVERIAERATLTIGASGAILACGAARLGLRVGYIGVAGDDPVGRFMLGALTARGVDVDHCRVHPSRPTGLSVILSRPGDRAIITALGTTDALTAGDVPTEAVANARHVHVASLYLQHGLRPGVPGLFAAARRAGATTSVDTNWDPSDRWDALEAVLAETDVFMPNAQEACRIARTADVEEALGRLAGRVGTVAVKLGADGAVARRGDERASAAAPAAEVVDTTGAGDTFGAGLLAGLLDGRPLADALRLAVACGTLSTRAAGGTDAQPTLEEAMAAAGL
jgi:sugar/nucleoside kinase (ribokinase family)